MCWPMHLICNQKTVGSIPITSTLKHNTMANIDKKKKKLQERIDFLQAELTTSLTKKSGKLVEINVGEFQRKINELRLELSKM